MKQKRKLILIGWDAADWKIIDALIAKKQMPALERLIKGGVSGNISTLDPPFSPMLWTTIATGVYPDKHGVLGFVEVLPDKIGVRNISSASRKVKALWNIFTQQGMTSHVVGWWPSNPAEAIKGTMVSNLYKEANVDTTRWKMPAHTIHPDDMKELYGNLRVHPSELTEAHLLPFVPHAREINQKEDERLYRIAKNIAEAATIHSAATYILDNEEWDFVAVYLDTLDHFSHGFMNYHPPKMSIVSDRDYYLYKDVIKSAYRFHDMMLDQILRLAGDDATIMLISDHGFHSDHLRPSVLPDEPGAPALQHRDHGIFVVKGPGIRANDKVYGASLIDIAPTILSLYGLAIGKDMPGRPLTDIYQSPPKLTYISSWEDVEGYSGMPSGHMEEEDPVAAQEGLRQLVELGYIDDPGENVQESVELTIRETKFCLARVYLSTGRSAEAIPILEQLHREMPEESRFGFRLMAAYMQTGLLQKALDLAENQVPVIQEAMNQLNGELYGLRDAFESGDKEKKDLVVKKLRRFKNYRKDFVRIDLLRADVLMKMNDPGEAIAILKKLEDFLPGQRPVLSQLGKAYLQTDDLDTAEEYYEKLLKVDPNDHTAYHGLAVISLRKKAFEKAAGQALKSIELNYHYPNAHFHLGMALTRLELFEDAARAFEVCLRLDPGMGKARNQLIDIYENELNLPESAQRHRDSFIEAAPVPEADPEADPEAGLKEPGPPRESDPKPRKFRDPVIVVSGLPRSGTSMMMQMLHNGGVELLTDGARKADENNPKGYFEFEAVRRLQTDKSWLSEAKNKGVKIISHLLPELPGKYRYKVILMERNMEEIIRSQHLMLERLGKVRKGTYVSSVDMTFRHNLEKVAVWAEERENVDLLYVKYSDVIADPKRESERVSRFLHLDLHIDKMCLAVDQSLYRTKM